MKDFYNNITFILEFQKRTGYSMSYPSILAYVKKGYIKVSGHMQNGKQRRPVYDEKSLVDFIERFPKLREQGKIKLVALSNA